MESLPLELLGHITHHLTASELIHLALTHKPMFRSIQTLYQRPQDNATPTVLSRPNLQFVSIESFHSHLELYANTVYSLLESVDYDAQLKNANAQRAHVARPFELQVTDVRLDVPATLDDVWNILQHLEIRFKHFG